MPRRGRLPQRPRTCPTVGHQTRPGPRGAIATADWYSEPRPQRAIGTAQWNAPRRSPKPDRTGVTNAVSPLFRWEPTRWTFPSPRGWLGLAPPTRTNAHQRDGSHCRITCACARARACVCAQARVCWFDRVGSRWSRVSPCSIRAPRQREVESIALVVRWFALVGSVILKPQVLSHRSPDRTARRSYLGDC